MKIQRWLDEFAMLKRELSFFMDHEHHTHQGVTTTHLRDYIPLLVVAFYIVGGSFLLRTIIPGSSWLRTVEYFEGLMLVLFGLFKLMNISGFQEGFRMYDLITQRVAVWGYLYPFIELLVGVHFLLDRAVVPMAIFITVLSVVGIISVSIELKKDRKFQCACLGTALNVPLTYVTLIENGIMLAMAAIMIVYR